MPSDGNFASPLLASIYLIQPVDGPLENVCFYDCSIGFACIYPLKLCMTNSFHYVPLIQSFSVFYTIITLLRNFTVMAVLFGDWFASLKSKVTYL